MIITEDREDMGKADMDRILRLLSHPMVVVLISSILAAHLIRLSLLSPNTAATPRAIPPEAIFLNNETPHHIANLAATHPTTKATVATMPIHPFHQERTQNSVKASKASEALAKRLSVQQPVAC